MEIIRRQMAYNYSVRTQPIKYIVIHDTGNPSAGADADANFRYFNTGDRGSSADWFVDDTYAVQANDYMKYYSWHCGDGHGKYGITNSNSVGVEICINSDGDYDKAVSNAVELTRALMNELNIPIDRVVRHYDASRKTCPGSMSSNNWAAWEQFKKRVAEGDDELMSKEYEELKAAIDNLTETVKQLAVDVADLKNPMIYNYIDDNMPEWARPTIQKLVDKGALKGDENGLNLDDNMLRMLVINDRMGLYE